MADPVRCTECNEELDPDSKVEVLENKDHVMVIRHGETTHVIGKRRLGRGLDALLGDSKEFIIPLDHPFAKAFREGLYEVLPQICPHEILEFYGRNGGVRCVGCATEWKRVRKYIGQRPTKSVSLLLKQGGK